MISVDSILNEISDLSLEDKKIIEDILHKRVIEERREEIYNNYKIALKDYQNNKVLSGTENDLIDEVIHD